MERMGAVDREKLEEAAATYFAELQAIADQPRDIPADYFEQELDFQTTETQQELAKLDGALTSRQFGLAAEQSARRMTQAIGTDFDLLDPEAQRMAKEYAVRAERQQMRHLLQSLTQPATRFIADDELFAPTAPRSAQYGAPNLPSGAAPPVVRPEITLERGIDMYIAYKTKKGWQGSMREESLRVLRWLGDEIDLATPVSAITDDQVRAFRDCILDLAVGSQGKNTPLRQRVAIGDEPRLTFATRVRYWRSIRSFFAWFRSEYKFPNPTEGLLFEGGRNEVSRTPAPFSSEELRKLLSTPLFAGYKSPHRLKQEGDCLYRRGHWWAGVLMMHTGLRAGDCAQLLPSDFLLDDEIPHLIIQPGTLSENVAKRSKFGTRVHYVPLLPILFDLGLRQFVEARSKRNPKKRLFYEISLGANRMSAGMTKFWQPYLEAFGLFKPGRATHVFRHTVANRLRDHAFSHNEDIGAVLGHTIVNRETKTTGKYGGPQGLKRTVDTLSKLDFGFDVLEALGGPYDPKRHK
jgi:integrase